jgi:hypothetical protein
MTLSIIPTHFDNASIGISNPMCLLITVTSLCDLNKFMKPSSDKFPIRLEFNRGTMTTHCRHYPMDQVSCLNGALCNDKIICNLKMNGSRFYEDWSWDCNANGGAVYYESCLGNKDKTCINVGSFHYRFDNVQGPIKIIKDNTSVDRIINRRTYADIILQGIFGFMMIMGMIVFTGGVLCIAGEGFFNILLGGFAIFSLCLLGGSSDDSEWHDTNAICDD